MTSAPDTGPSERGWRLWAGRLGWFVGLWAAGVLTLAAVAYGIRAWIGS